MIEHAYIHIPFCISKCNYCSFVSGYDIEGKDDYINALIKEISSRYKNEQLKTIYIGGGTPSLLEAKDVEKILNHLKFQNDSEITIEANPETISTEKFIHFKNMGINRVSIGVQTFNDDILKIIGRTHNKNKIYSAIEAIKNSGFKNVSIDLIYGLPNQTFNVFCNDLEQAINLDINHISTYGLKIEEDSFFGKSTPLNLPDDEMQAQMFLYLCRFLDAHHFNHYEISNFAKNGFESKHNCAYWHNKNYYGFGLNASGYEGNIRYKNISEYKKYIDNPLQKEEEIELTLQQIREEELFLALRLKEGVDISKIDKTYLKNIQKYLDMKLLKIENEHLKLTKEGILLSNEIMAEFII